MRGLLEKSKAVMALAGEYKPLTEYQWEHLSEADKDKWKRFEKLRPEYKQMKSGTAGTFDAKLIELMFEADE